MRCSICGANCRCKNARAGICCSCHPHKGGRAAAHAGRARRKWERDNIYYTKSEAEAREPELELDAGMFGV